MLNEKKDELGYTICKNMVGSTATDRGWMKEINNCARGKSMMTLIKTSVPFRTQ